LESGWRSPSSNHFSGELENALGRINALAADGAALARRLSTEVAEWEEAAAALNDGGFGDGPIAIPPHIKFPLPPPYKYFPWPYSGLINFYPGWPSRPGPTAPGGGWGGDGGFPGGFPGGGGGGGGGGAWGSEGPSMPYIDTEYLLIRGHQQEIMLRYREGELTWEQMIGQLEEMERSTHPDYVDTKLTFIDFGEAKGEASVAWKENQISGKYGTIDAAVGEAAADGEASARYGEDGLEGTLWGTAGIYAINGEASGTVAGVDLAGQAYLGAEVEGKAEARIDLLAGTVAVGTGVNAFVGAKAEGAATKKDVLVKGADVTAKGAIMTGAGIVAEGEFGYDDHVIKADFDLGAAWGIGAEIGFEVELNVAEAGEDIAKIGRDAILTLFNQ
jgi:hypothetical protein